MKRPKYPGHGKPLLLWKYHARMEQYADYLENENGKMKRGGDIILVGLWFLAALILLLYYTIKFS